MKIIFIHSGKNYHEHLGPHYGPLIRHSLHLLPIESYLNGSIEEKTKYRAIQSLSTGCIIGMVLIDRSYWFTSNDLSNPWAHGPYCYHIHDAVRLTKPVQCRGQMGVWKIPQSTKREIESMRHITMKSDEWKDKYDIMNAENIYHALTIMQPFAEAIIRKIKTVENRGSRILMLTENDGIYRGCRICIGREQERKQNDNDNDMNVKPFNYKQYGQQFIDQLEYHGHSKLPQYQKETANWRYHQRATVIKCQCSKKLKKMKRANNGKQKKQKKDDNGDNRRNTNKSKKKIKATPLPCFGGGSKRRKPSRNRGKGRGIIKDRGNERDNNKITSYYKKGSVEEEYEPDTNSDGLNGYGMRKCYDLRDKRNNNQCLMELKAMGYDKEEAMAASDKYVDIEDAVAYLEKLKRVQNTRNLGYSHQLNSHQLNVNSNVLNTNNGNIVKRMKEKKQNNRKRRKMNEEDEEEDIDINMNKKKKRKLNHKYNEYEQLISSSDYNEDSAMDDALKASQKTYDDELKVRTAINRSKYHGSTLDTLPVTNKNGNDRRKWKKKVMIDLDLTVSDSEDQMDENGNRKQKLSSLSINKIPRRRCE